MLQTFANGKHFGCFFHLVLKLTNILAVQTRLDTHKLTYKKTILMYRTYLNCNFNKTTTIFSVIRYTHRLFVAEAFNMTYKQIMLIYGNRYLFKYIIVITTTMTTTTKATATATTNNKIILCSKIKSYRSL